MIAMLTRPGCDGLERPVAALVLALALAGLGAPVAAQTNAAVPVTATVVSGCRITSPPGSARLDFGAIDPLASGSVPSTAIVQLACGRGARPLVGLNNGRNAGGGSKRMRSGTTANYLRYSIRRPTGVAIGNSGTCAESGAEWNARNRLNLSTAFAAAGGAVDVKLCGYVPRPQANVRALGTPYTDTVTLTVQF
jgi:spore coat protein U-like protein